MFCHYMPLSAFPSGWTGCSVKICQLWWLQTYRKASFTIVGFSWTKYANSYIARVERTSHHVWCQVLVKSGTLERILSTLPRISHFGRGYHYSAGFTPCQQAQPPIWFFLVCELLLTECLWGRLFTRCPPTSISNVNQTIHWVIFTVHSTISSKVLQKLWGRGMCGWNSLLP